MGLCGSPRVRGRARRSAVRCTLVVPDENARRGQNFIASVRSDAVVRRVCACVPDADKSIDELTRNVTRQPEPAPGCRLDLAADFGFGQLASCVQPGFVPQWYDSALLSQRPRAGPSGLNGLALSMNAATRMVRTQC